MKKFYPPEPIEPEIAVYQVPITKIGYLTSLLEAHEGVGQIRTLDKSRGIIEFWIMPDFATDFANLLDSVRDEVKLQRLSRNFE